MAGDRPCVELGGIRADVCDGGEQAGIVAGACHAQRHGEVRDLIGDPRPPAFGVAPGFVVALEDNGGGGGDSGEALHLVSGYGHEHVVTIGGQVLDRGLPSGGKRADLELCADHGASTVVEAG